MAYIFDKGYFAKFAEPSTQIRDSALLEEYKFAEETKENVDTIFISHSHAELDDIRGIITRIEKLGKYECYVDNDDHDMPKNTNGNTAKLLKQRIRNAKKFILILTEKSIDSKWCNWELGFGDYDKFGKNAIAILPITETRATDRNFIGKEYLSIYHRVSLSTKKNLLVIDPTTDEAITFKQWMNL